MAASVTPEEWTRVARQIVPGCNLMRTWPLQGGISAQMTALEVLGADGQIQRLVVRQPNASALRRNPNAAANEYRILQTVRALDVAAPQPYLLDETRTVLPVPYLILAYIDGAPDYAPADVAGYAVQCAAQLAALHRIDGGLPALAALPRQADTLTQRLQAAPIHLDDSLQEGLIRAVLMSAWPLPARNPPVLLHGDFWPGNLLWRNGQLVAVVDWEDAAVGNPLADFAVSRLDLLWILGAEAMRIFTAHYQAQVDLDYSQLPYWDLAAALRPAGRLADWAADWATLGRPDITESAMRAAHRWFVQQALTRLSIASGS